MRKSFIFPFVCLIIFLVVYMGKTAVCLGGQQQWSIDTVKQLEEKDFSITDCEDTICLDIPFKDFHSHKVEERVDFVGWIYSGEFAYKYNRHVYGDFDIYTSNANYNLKNRNFDDRYISQITLKNANLKTLRGISLGSTLQDVINLYGEGQVQKSNSDYVIYQYRLEDRALQFKVDKEQKVAGITLLILVQTTGHE